MENEYYYSFKYSEENEIIECSGHGKSVLEISKLFDDKLILELEIKKII